MNWLRGTIALGIFLAVGSAQAKVQSPAEIARDIGLLGRWAEDCTKPPSHSNSYATYVASSNGQVDNQWYSDAGVTDRRRFVSIVPSGPDRFDIQMQDALFGLIFSTIEIVGDRKRTLFMARGSFVLVRDGLDLDTGEPMTPEYKCELGLS